MCNEKQDCYLAVIWLSSEHFGGHPESRAHQREFPAGVFHWQLHHLPGQAEVCHQSLSSPRRHPDQAVLQIHEEDTEEQDCNGMFVPAEGSVRLNNQDHQPLVFSTVFSLCLGFYCV